MPSPTLLERSREWCTTSISSIQQSVHQIYSSLCKPGLEVPRDILEIQALTGQKPGEKWKSFNAMVNAIVENVKNGGELNTQLSQISPFLLNLVKVNVAVKLQLSNLIVEALKSENVSIVRKALSARWFFDGGNPNVNAEYFTRDILAFASVRTRLDIVKRLARGLQGHEEKARVFFDEFVNLYDVQENLPILTACSKSFIFDAILRYKIILPMKTLKVLYSKHRGLAVDYLQLGNHKNSDNADHRKVHEITINDYDVFLPTLIRYYPQDFVSLYELTPEKNLATLSIQRSTLLLKNVKDTIISKPDIFLKLLNSKVVKQKLAAAEIETMLEHYLPSDVNDFLLHMALDYVDDYLGSDKIQVLLNKFEKKYNKNLLEYARNLINFTDPDNKQTNSVLKLLRRLPADEREIQVRMLLSNIEEGSSWKDEFMSYLKPSESLPFFKNKIAKASSSDERLQLIGLMIISCGVQNSSKDLLNVLQYYKDRHKNEPKIYVFFEHLIKEFDLKALDDDHWRILRDFINNAYVKKKLFIEHVTLIETVLEAALHNAMKKKNDQYVDKVIEMIVECKAENFSPTWNVLQDNLALEKDCLERFIVSISVKYPEEHPIWKMKNNRLVIALSLLKSISSYNDRCAVKISKKKKGSKEQTPQLINLQDYPWIIKLSEEFFGRSETGVRKEKLRKILKRLDPDFYETKMNECVTARDIGSAEALQLLKRQPEKVRTNWLDYLNEAREKLQASKRYSLDKARESLRARSFVAATKWHHEIPLKFIETCYAEIKVEGSLAVLGILLPGDTLEKVAAAFVPKEAEIQLTDNSAKENFELTRAALQSMKLSNPPVSLESLQAFCHGDYISLADGTLMSLARRVNVASAVDFAKKLASQPQASLMKRGVRLARSVTTKQQFCDILIKTWQSSTDVSIRKVLAKMIFNVFIKTPNAENWKLMRSCLRGLTLDDRDAVEDLHEIEKVGAEFVSDYVEEYLKKVEELFYACLDFKWRTKSVCLLVESFDERLVNEVSEEVSLKVLQKYFFDADCSEISSATRLFALRYYLLASGEKFTLRLHGIVKILTKTMENFDLPHPKKRRYYPANYSVQEFFGDLLTELSASESDKKLQIIDSVLGVFNLNLSPWQEPSSYMALNLYKEYLLSTSPQDFGMRTARRISSLVEDFSSNEPIADIADCLNDFIFNKIFRDYKNPFDLKLALVEGLMQSDEHYGALASTKLLDPHEVSEYDERYDRYISTLRQMKNSSIQYNLYQHINNLTEL